MNNEPTNPSTNQPNTVTPMVTPDVSPSAPVAAAPTNDVPITPPVASVPPAPSAPAEPNKNPLKALALVGLVVVIAVLAVGGVYASEHKKVTDLQSAQSLMNTQLVAAKSTDYRLPDGAIQVSGCIPSQGFHNLIKGGDKEYGPFVLTNKAHKVIGLEFMAAPDMYTAIPGTSLPVAVITKNSPTVGWKFDHAEFSQLSKGHPGLERNHIDVHMFIGNQQQEQDACK